MEEDYCNDELDEIGETTEIDDDHSETWGGGIEISPEGESLEADLVEEDEKGYAETEISKGEESGTEENPVEVKGYDEPEDEEQEGIETSFSARSAEAHTEAGTAEFSMESVIGPDGRKRVNNTKPFPWRSICLLEIEAADGRRYIGSGNFIGPHTVMTAGHCIYMHKHGGWVKKIKVIPGRNGTNLPFGYLHGTRFVSVKGWTKKQKKTHDYGAIILSSDVLGKKVGWMGFAALTWINLIRLRVNNSGYPADKTYGTQWWNCNRVVKATSRMLYYLVDTYGGQSGSPVWRYKKGKRHQVAIHAYGGSSSNSGARITKPVFKNMKNWKK